MTLHPVSRGVHVASRASWDLTDCSHKCPWSGLRIQLHGLARLVDDMEDLGSPVAVIGSPLHSTQWTHLAAAPEQDASDS